MAESFQDAVAESRQRAHDLIAENEIIRTAMPGICQSLEERLVAAGIDPARRDLMDAILFGMAMAELDYKDDLTKEATKIAVLLMAPEPGLAWSVDALE